MPLRTSRRGARSTGLLAPGLLLLVSAGCDDLVQAIEDKAQQVGENMSAPSEGEAPDAPEATEEEKLAVKLGLYVECINRSSQRIHDSWSRFSSRAKEDGTPKKKGVIPFLYKIDSELTPCEEAVASGPTMEPPLPELDEAMGRYLAHGRVFAEHTVELDRYFEHEDFEDDDWAKAKELAPEIAAAYQSWSEADRALGDLVSAKQDVVELEMLRLVETRDGREIEWHCRNVAIAAKTFVRCLSAEDATAEGCEEPFDALVAAEEGLRAYAEANEERSEAVFWMSAFASSADDTVAQSKKAMRTLRDGKGSRAQIAEVVSEYDDLVRDSNNLRFER